jgi:RimJ/RimL family protein N-acetyltransferase
LEPEGGAPGKKIAQIRLEDLMREDFERIRPWIDPKTFRIFHAPVDDEQLTVLLTAHESGRPTSLGYRIVRVSDAEIVGVVHATIDWKNNLAHIGQIVVDPLLRGAGIGAASLKLILDLCLNELRLHRAQLFVDEDNAEAIACYRKIGFQVEGLMREATKVGTDYVSWHSMSILEDEWRRSGERRYVAA